MIGPTVDNRIRANSVDQVPREQEDRRRRKRGTDYYRELLTKQALLLEQHPCGADLHRSTARRIRRAIEEERPLALLEILSSAAGLMLKGLDLTQKGAWQRSC